MNGLEGFDAHWVWIAIGLVLAALEMLVPGVYLIWLAIEQRAQVASILGRPGASIDDVIAQFG